MFSTLYWKNSQIPVLKMWNCLQVVSYYIIKFVKYANKDHQNFIIWRGCRHETIMDQDLCKSDLELYFWKSFNADHFYFHADWRISNKICHFVTFEKSKTTCPFNWNEASRLSYLTGILTKLPGEHIPFYTHLILCLNPQQKHLLLSGHD